ncbi:MAG: alpha/beta fold hydrolase [Clostridiales bacterium]|nr:alpha/beta fold hydrolase [Clostridiales bacterium]
MKPNRYSHLVCPSSLFAAGDGSVLYAAYSWDGSRSVCKVHPGKTDSAFFQLPADPDPSPASDGENTCYLASGHFCSTSGFTFAEDGWQVYGFSLTDNGKVLIRERRSQACEKPYLSAEELPYRRDADHGMLKKYHYRLLLVDLPSAANAMKPPVFRMLQEGESDWRFPACFENCMVYGRKQWTLLNLEDGSETKLCENFVPGGFAPVFSPCGQYILAPGYWDDSPDLTLRRIWLDASRPSEPVAGLPDIVGRGNVYADLSPDTPRLLTVWKNGFLLVGISQGTLRLYRIQETDGTLCAEPCLSHAGSVFEVTASGNHAAVLWGDSTHKPQICPLKEEPEFSFSLITENAYPEEDAVPSLAITAPSQDGKACLHAWLLLPKKAGTCSVPLLVWVHGGPEGLYSDALEVEKQAAVSRGFAVLLPNPRGSSGYGPEYQHTGEEFSEGAAGDVLTLVDSALRAYPCLNRERIGILGGSYGGFMSAYLAGHTDRFHAAVILKPVTNWLTIHFKSSQSGQPVFSEHFSFRDFLSDTFRMSPASMADHIHIPTLLIHGEEDQQCPPENSLQLFRLIQTYHPEIPCRLRLYPNCCHAYSRDGLEDYLSIQEETLKWMETYLR